MTDCESKILVRSWCKTQITPSSRKGERCVYGNATWIPRLLRFAGSYDLQLHRPVQEISCHWRGGDGLDSAEVIRGRGGLVGNVCDA